MNTRGALSRAVLAHRDRRSAESMVLHAARRISGDRCLNDPIKALDILGAEGVTWHDVLTINS